MHNRLRYSQLRLRSQGGARAIFVNPRHGPVLQPDGGVEAKERRVSAETPEIVGRDRPSIWKRCGCATR
jgi:hypothetical protein